MPADFWVYLGALGDIEENRKSVAPRCRRRRVENTATDRNLCIFGDPQYYPADMVYGRVCNSLPGNFPDLLGRASNVPSQLLSKQTCRALDWRHRWDTRSYSTWGDGNLSPKRR